MQLGFHFYYYSFSIGTVIWKCEIRITAFYNSPANDITIP
jgi:hypothetical protein